MKEYKLYSGTPQGKVTEAFEVIRGYTNALEKTIDELLQNQSANRRKGSTPGKTCRRRGRIHLGGSPACPTGFQLQGNTAGSKCNLGGLDFGLLPAAAASCK